MTTTAAKAGYFEARFFHKVFQEEFAQARGHFSPINSGARPPCSAAAAGRCRQGTFGVAGPPPNINWSPLSQAGAQVLYGLWLSLLLMCLSARSPGLGLLSRHPLRALSAAVAFSPDGTSFVTGAEEGNVRLHHFDADYFQIG